MKLSKIISPDEFRELADCFYSDEPIQETLRRFADNLEANEAWLEAFVEEFSTNNPEYRKFDFIAKVMKNGPLLSDEHFTTEPKTEKK